MESIELYTIGYEDRQINDFIDRLQHFGIIFLIDVRENPVSRKKGFSKSKLKENLESRNITYLHLKELGSPKELREKLYKDNDYETFFNAYRDYLSLHSETAVSLYKDTISHYKSCLMCMEREPSYCHRKIVAEKIKEIDGNGLKIKHI
jgi:uncharacterized protein (DUF488 family)